MKKSNNINNLKYILVILVIALGVKSAMAFPAPANPPSNDISGFINTTAAGQAKGGTPTNPSIITLETKGLMSGNNLAVWGSSTKVLSGYVQINSITPRVNICSDNTGKLSPCPYEGYILID